MGDYPQYRYASIQTAAAAFLKELNPDGIIPVPIEMIVERKGIDIVPFPGLEEAYEAVGFTPSSLSSIYVDEHVYKFQETRYRFTLAHEKKGPGHSRR